MNTNAKAINTYAEPTRTDVKPINTYVKPMQAYVKPIKTNAETITAYVKPIKTYVKPIINPCKAYTKICNPRFKSIAIQIHKTVVYLVYLCVHYYGGGFGPPPLDPPTTR